MSTKHTPGPWAFEIVPWDATEQEGPESEWTGIYIGREDDERPGQVFGTIIEGAFSHAPNDGDPEADARLIAAAPDIYEALKAIVEHETTGEFHTWAKKIEAAKAALAKADGGEP